MLKITKQELDKQIELFGAEVVTDKQLAQIVDLNLIQKSLSKEEISINEAEIKSFQAVEVYDDKNGRIEKSIMFMRPKQVEWANREAGEGIYLDTELNRQLNRVGDEIKKGKKAVAGEIREWGGKRYKKQANGKWLEVSEHGMTKKEHQKQTSKFPYIEGTRNPRGREFNQRHHKKHFAEASKLSDKEYSDEEVGLGKNNIEVGSSVKYEKTKSGGAKIPFKGKIVSIDKDGKYAEVRNSIGDIDYVSVSSLKVEGETFRIKSDAPYMSSLANLTGKDLKSKGTKEVDFATGKQTYHIFEVDGKEHEVPERFLEKK